jgi:hypothetical protein
MIAVSEVKGVMPIADPHGHGVADDAHPGIKEAAHGHA